MRKILPALLLILAALPALAQVTITNVFVSASTATTATIQWTTSGPSTSQVLYGFDSSIPFGTPVSPQMVTSHSVTLTVLDPSRFYFFAVSSIDGAGHVTQSATENFGLCGGSSQPFNPATGTINNYYEYGSFTLTWNPPSGSSATPTVCGQPMSTTITGVLSGGASMSASVADSYKVIPGPGSWHVAATDAGNLAPISFDYPLSAQNTDVSQQLAAAASTAGLVDVLANTVAHTIFPSWICTTFNNLCSSGGGAITEIIPGTNVTCTPFVSGNCVGNVTINSTATGGSVAAAPQFQLAYYPTPGTVAAVAGSGATTDAAGNVRVRSDDGINHAFLSQSSPGANDGIQNSLQAIGNFVVVGPDYASVEGIYGDGLCPNYRLAIGCPPPFANGTEMTDYRPGMLGTYTYNTFLSAGSTTWKFDRWIQNQLAPNSLSATNFPYLWDFEMTGSGLNGFNVNTGPDSFGSFQYNYELMTRGIVSAVNYQQNAYALGDNHLFQLTMNNQRGSTDGSGEGFNIFRWQVNQNLTPMVMTANSTFAAGATLIKGTLISSVPFVGDGTYLMNFSQGSAVFNITADQQPNPGAGIAGEFTYSITVTPDNIGNVAAAVNTPVQRYGGTTNETVNITGLTTALSTAESVCVADGNYIESAALVSAGSFSSGTATGAVIAMRYNHQPGFYVAQGSHACNVVEMRANEEPGSFATRQLIRTIGARTSHQVLYSRIVFGGWNDAFSGYASTEVIALAGVTLTRNGGGTSVTVSDSFLHLNNVAAIVSGCSDSSFNGIWQSTSDTGTTLTWNNTGSTTTTTCTADIEVLSRRNTFSVRSAQEFPAAEIVNTNDPTTFALNYNISVEPNTNLHVVSGNQLENHPYSDIIMGIDRNLWTFHSQNSNSIADVMHGDQYDGAIPSAFAWWTLKLTDNPLGYIGLGGSKPVGAVLFNMSGSITPFGSLFFGLPVPEGSVFSFNGCSFACSDIRSQFTFYSFEMDGGDLAVTINQASHLVQTINQDVTTGQIFITTESDQGKSWFVSNGLTGGANLENLYEFTPGLTKFTVSSNSGSIHNILQLTPTLTSSNVPLALPVLESGTASNTDLVGELPMTGGTSVSYTFIGAYVVHPECFAQAQGTTVSPPWVTYTGTTSFTINTTVGFTGNVSYFCAMRN